MAKFMRSDKGADENKSSPSEATATGEPERVQRQEPLKSPRQSAEPSVISPSLKITGNLESDAEIQLEGTVEGDVRAQIVTVGAGATVKGAIFGETVNIAGTTDGEIEARIVVVEKTARVTGDIVHESLQIEAGAYVNGHCRPEFGKRDRASALPKTAGPGQHAETDGPKNPTSATGNAGLAAV